MGDWWRKRGALYKKKRFSYENRHDAKGPQAYKHMKIAKPFLYYSQELLVEYNSL